MEKRTVYFDAKLARELRLIAAGNDTSVSVIINNVLKDRLAKDAENYTIVEQRKNEPTVPLEKILKDFKKKWQFLK